MSVHFIQPVRGLKFGDECADPSDGLTSVNNYVIGAGTGLLVSFPALLSEGNDRRLQFGLCCRATLVLEITPTLNGAGDQPATPYIVTKFDDDGTVVEWDSSLVTLVTGTVVTVTITLNIGACGAIIEIDSLLHATPTGSVISVNPIL
mgnify:CR=1 FL=1